MTAAQVLTATAAAADEASSVHVEAAGESFDDATPVEWDVRLSDEGGAGRISFGGRPIDVLRVGETTYFRAPPDFFRTEEGVPDDIAADVLGNRWIVSSPGGMSGYATTVLATPGALIENILSAGNRQYENTGETTADGRPAVALRDTGSGAVLHVAATGAPLPLAYSIDDRRQTVTFDDWDEPVEAEAPADPLEPTGAQDQAIDAAFSAWFPPGMIS